MTSLGTVAELWRYPVKSMRGERIDGSHVSERGLTGDRGHALRDVETGKVVSAKRPRLWGRMLDFAARLEPDGAVTIAAPDGTELAGDDPDIDRILSEALGRKVSLISSTDDTAMLEEVWIPEKQSEPYGPVVGSEGEDRLIEIPASIGAPPGTLFDYSAMHLVTTATLAALSEAYADGRFDVRRFRPNVVVDVPGRAFAENEWVGRTIRIGDEVRIEVVVPTPRCVMTTLPQADLPKDPGILRTAAQNNARDFGPFAGQPCVGVYAEVVSGGTIRAGDSVVEDQR
jgi:MOSC domain-containing protein